MLSHILRWALHVRSFIVTTLWRATFIIQHLVLRSAATAIRPSHQNYSVYINRYSYHQIHYENALPEHSMRLKLHLLHEQWHVKTSFNGILPDMEKPKRREDFQNLCQKIDFNKINLLRDTVTELFLAREPVTAIGQTWQRLPVKQQTTAFANSQYTPRSLWLHIREDPSRVRYPSFYGNIIDTVDISKINKLEELSRGVHKVRVTDSEDIYVYKEIQEISYVPKDTEVLEQEIQNLQLRIKGVVRLITIVTSRNVYQTSEAMQCQTITRGFLLDYHPRGTLNQAMQLSEHLCCHQWALQIALTLERLHNKGITHMDLKPSNIVINSDSEAILIDISGIGGMTWGWFAPEIHASGLSENFEQRRQNDIWAFGKILSIMADASHNIAERKLLMEVSQKATTENIPRIPLEEAIWDLSSFLSPTQ